MYIPSGEHVNRELYNPVRECAAMGAIEVISHECSRLSCVWDCLFFNVSPFTKQCTLVLFTAIVVFTGLCGIYFCVAQISTEMRFRRVLAAVNLHDRRTNGTNEYGPIVSMSALSGTLPDSLRRPSAYAPGADHDGHKTGDPDSRDPSAPSVYQRRLVHRRNEGETGEVDLTA